MITSHIPKTWQQFESEVGRILSECGFSVEFQKHMELERGFKNIDVYAEESVNGLMYKMIFECKYLKNPVIQDTIHSFRTVVSGCGANVGYIVSLSGFQSGSFKASNLTNVRLVTWEEFQSSFEKRWYVNHFIPLIAQAIHPLLKATLKLLSTQLEGIPEATRVAASDLRKRYEPFVAVIENIIPLHPVYFPERSTNVYVPLIKKLDGRILYPDSPIDLPLVSSLRPEQAALEGDPQAAQVILESLPSEILGATGYREFYRLALQNAHKVLDHDVVREIINAIQANANWSFLCRDLAFAKQRIEKFDAHWNDDI